MKYMCAYFIVSCLLNIIFHEGLNKDNNFMIGIMNLFLMPVIFVAAVVCYIKKEIKEKKDAE